MSPDIAIDIIYKYVPQRQAEVCLGLLLGVTEDLAGPTVMLQLALEVAGAAQDAVDGGRGPGEVSRGVTCVRSCSRLIMYDRLTY